MKITVDGNMACARMAYKMSEICSIYPITPSSPMAEDCDEWRTKGDKNIFGEVPNIVEMQSEAGVAGCLHGALAGGALATTFTSSQGLLLMIPDMYKMAGELLPHTMHVASRALSTHALSIFGDQTDVMAVRSTGYAMLLSSSVQEAQDMALISHIASLKSSVPFLHFFDGFRTSHEIESIDEIPDEEIKKLLPMAEIKKFKSLGLSSSHPHQQGTAQNPDIYFQNRESANLFYSNVIDSVKQTMQRFEEVCGRHYAPFEYYGDENAKYVVVIMGSASQTVRETITELNNNYGTKLGVVSVHLYRPFSSIDLSNSIPQSTQKICVLDRTKDCGADGEPLYKDVINALFHAGRQNIKIIGGRYGVGGKEFTPSMAKSVFDNLMNECKDNFTIGINDDVTKTSLSYDKDFYIKHDTFACKFYGLGSDGTVGANKNSIKIIGTNTDLNVQGYFEYDSKKSGSVTISHLRFGKAEIKSPYLITRANFVACHNINFMGKYAMEEDLIDEGTFLLNSPYDEKELPHILPKKSIEILHSKKAKLYIVDANKLALECGLGSKINVIMQACFFKLTNILPYNDVENILIDTAIKSYAKKGQEIVDANIKAIKVATQNLKEVDLEQLMKEMSSTKQIEDSQKYDEYYDEFIKKIEHKKGDDLPVSAFDPRGYIPTNTSKFEKRGISIQSPCWIKENCIQCNMCSFVCPHAAIRPVLISDEELKSAPHSFETNKALGINGFNFRMQVNVADCTGCENCVHVCPAKEKALKMIDSATLSKQENENYKYSENRENVKTIFSKNTIKGSQFEKPYFEFSGACSGCGETPYIKLVSQLFGKRMIIANATGCSSIYSGSAPTSPFAKNSDGRGPAWASSLFEDNAEFGYGIALSKKQKRAKLKEEVASYITNSEENKLTALLKTWLDNFDNAEMSYELSKEIVPLIHNTSLEELSDSFVKESIWLIGGDGWAYDIGYGGLDHVLASGENVNVLVLDTEVYSNTGGQMSKSTPLSATAKFASSGKRTAKKDLGKMAMTYKNVYVAQIGMGADLNQTVKAISEAESYDGPSLIIAYAPCINHGINMSKAQTEIRKAVDCGYWHLYRYDPRLREQGKNPFQLDSHEPKLDYEEFLKGEARFMALNKLNPTLAQKLFEESKKLAKEKYDEYLSLAQNNR